MSAQALAPKRLLFIGDSLTYVNDLDQRVAFLARAAGFSEGLVIDRVVKGGAPLKKLWTKTKAKQVIKGEAAADGGARAPWDAVILQEDLPETDVESFNSFAHKFHHVIAAAGAATVLIAAWPYQRLPEFNTEAIARAHVIAAETMTLGPCCVVHVGRAWAKAAEKHPELQLYSDDQEHPALLGTALAAASVFSALWGRSASVQTTSRGAGNDQEDEDLKRLHDIAWQLSHHKPSTLNPKPHPKSYTLNPKP